MEITRKTLSNGHEYIFVCQSRGTRNGFAHDCSLMRDGREISKATCNYLNRTWESYRFRTVMKNAIYKLIDERIKEIETKFREDNGIKRMTEKRRKEFHDIADNDALIREYKGVYDII